MRNISLLLCSLLVACTFTIKDPDKKIFIKSVQSGNLTVDWYIYSLITSFSPAKIQVESDGHVYKVIEFGHGISDISLENQVLTIQTNGKPEFEIDTEALKNVHLEIRFDTNGARWNDGTSRFGRLRRKNVDHSRRHFVESYGTNYGD